MTIVDISLIMTTNACITVLYKDECNSIASSSILVEFGSGVKEVSHSTSRRQIAKRARVEKVSMTAR